VQLLRPGQGIEDRKLARRRDSRVEESWCHLYGDAQMAGGGGGIEISQNVKDFGVGQVSVANCRAASHAWQGYPEWMIAKAGET
jgi:hypothetical protein